MCKVIVIDLAVRWSSRVFGFLDLGVYSTALVTRIGPALEKCSTKPADHPAEPSPFVRNRSGSCAFNQFNA